MGQGLSQCTYYYANGFWISAVFLFYFIIFLVKGTISETHENHFVKFTQKTEIHKSTAEDVDVFPSQKKERKHNPFSLTFVVARDKMKPRFQLSPDKYVHLTYGMFWEIKQLVGQNPCHSPRFALCSRVGGHPVGPEEQNEQTTRGNSC